MISTVDRKHLEYLRVNDGWASQAYLRRNVAAINDLARRRLVHVVEGTRAVLTDAGRAELGDGRPKVEQLGLAI